MIFPGWVLAQETVTVRLDPAGESGVGGTATLVAAGDGTWVAMDITGLAPGAVARAAMHAGTCALSSASFAALPDLEADATGRAVATGSVLFQGRENVALVTMADGEHIIAIRTDQVVACGVIPKPESAPVPLALEVSGGTASPLVAGMAALVGMCALSAGLLRQGN